MKRLIYVFVAGLMLTACDLETSDNGPLDGFWQLTQLDTLSTGGTTDMRPMQLFWAVQMNLLEIQNKQDVYKSVLFRFDYTGESLTISSPYYNNREEQDPQVVDAAELKDYGLQALKEHFRVEQLKGNHMTLSSQTFRFHFRKY